MIGISVLSHQRRRGEKQTGEDRAVITAVHRILLEVEITPDAIQRAGIIGYGYNNERTLLKLKRGVPNAVSGRRQQWSFTHVHALQKHMEQYKSRWYLSVVAGCGCFFFRWYCYTLVRGWYKRLLYAQPCPYRTMEMPSGRLQAVWEYSRPRQIILRACPLVRAPKVKPRVGDDKIARRAQQHWIGDDVSVSANTWNTHSSFHTPCQVSSLASLNATTSYMSVRQAVNLTERHLPWFRKAASKFFLCHHCESRRMDIDLLNSTECITHRSSNHVLINLLYHTDDSQLVCSSDSSHLVVLSVMVIRWGYDP